MILGWSRNSDGSFDLIADLWGVAKKHNQTELINSINQKYAVNKTLAEVKQRGLQNANVKLVLQNSRSRRSQAHGLTRFRLTRFFVPADSAGTESFLQRRVLPRFSLHEP
jgi:hypothetical protein